MLLAATAWFSCDEDTEMDYATSTQSQKVTDPYLQINTPVIGFQAGVEAFDYSVNVINPSNDLALKEVKVYSVFTSAETGSLSNEGLLMTIPVEGPNRNSADGSFTYEDLKAGLTVDGGPLPDSDLDLKVGSGWKLRFEGVTSSGKVIPLKGSVNVAVLSPYAGLYKVLEGSYLRFDDVSGDYTGETRFIGSVDETTFSYNDYWGYFPWTGNQFNFKVDFENGNKVTVPILVDGLFSGTKALQCGVDPFIKFSCEGKNVLIKDPDAPESSNAKHRFVLLYGYLGAGGNREFYEELEKIVN
jgi:hypothetical protein